MHSKNKNTGFTLMELMIVITIIVILSGIVLTKIIDKPDSARVAKAKADIAELTTALNMYKLDNFQYPSSNQGLAALIKKPTDKPEPKNYNAKGYIDAKQVPKDPWGNDYVYLSPGLHGDFDLYSLGRDGVEGGAGYDADITNWDNK